MNDIPIMQVLNRQAYLCKFSQDFFFTHQTKLLSLDTLVLLFLYQARKILTVGEVHYDTQFLFCGNVNLSELYDVRMVQHLMDFGFFLGLLLLCRTHTTHINVLYNNEVSGSIAFTENSGAECTLTKSSNFGVFFVLLLFFFAFHF